MQGNKCEISETPNLDSPPQGQSIAGAALIVSLGNIASRIFGLIRDNRNAYFFGATGEMSAFEAASLVPKNIYELLVGGMVSAALVPVFSEYAAKEEREELWRLVSIVLSLVVVVMGGFLILAEVAAPLLARLLVGGFDARLQSLTAALIRIISPAVVFFGVSGILTAVLYAQQVFTYPAIGAAVFNLGGILGTQLLARRIGIASLTLGIVLGAFLQMAVQIPGLYRGRIRFSLSLKHPALQRIVVLYIPVVLSLIISQIGIVIDRNLASRVGEQAIAWMAAATRLREFPLGLVSTAVSMAVLPALSRLNLRSGREEFKETLALGLRLVLVLIVPATTGLFVLGVPIISLIFQHGEFTAFDTQQTARALVGYLLGTPFAAVDLLLIFAFYAQKDTVTPVVVGIVCVLIYLGVAPTFAFVAGFGMIGLVLANSVQLTSHAIIMLILLHRRVGSLAKQRLPLAMGKIVLASVVMGILVYLSLTMLRAVLPGGGFIARTMQVVVPGMVGLLVYAVGVTKLGVEEATLLFHLMRRRSRRKV
ncbi:MAG: murein biosynthesis integral membrane protein MurJ [Chloroflexi bacterium]|nr:murein biosynthesis integral membrane protein MurJ [Chloroflexota bacterium]